MIVQIFGGTLSHAMAHSLALAGGGAMHAVVSGSIATHRTKKARDKEKIFEETGGLQGYSRTKANKSVAKVWSAAVAGTGGFNWHGNWRSCRWAGMFETNQSLLTTFVKICLRLTKVGGI